MNFSNSHEICKHDNRRREIKKPGNKGKAKVKFAHGLMARGSVENKP